MCKTRTDDLHSSAFCLRRLPASSRLFLAAGVLHLGQRAGACPESSARVARQPAGHSRRGGADSRPAAAAREPAEVRGEPPHAEFLDQGRSRRSERAGAYRLPGDVCRWIDHGGRRDGPAGPPLFRPRRRGTVRPGGGGTGGTCADQGPAHRRHPRARRSCCRRHPHAAGAGAGAQDHPDEEPGADSPHDTADAGDQADRGHGGALPRRGLRPVLPARRRNRADQGCRATRQGHRWSISRWSRGGSTC